MSPARRRAEARTATISINGDTLGADLTVPEGTGAIVAFAHGSGSSRHSPRNKQVAAALGGSGLATLLLDLLTEEEEAADLRTGRLRFDIGLLGQRVVRAVDWLTGQPETADLRIGLFGASTGAAAALTAAAARPDAVGAVVSRGGRPDLADEALANVRSPTLLIVGGADHPVIDMNRTAMEQMAADVALEIVPGAGHLFEEPGALEEVARLAGEHFRRHLAA